MEPLVPDPDPRDAEPADALPPTDAPEGSPESARLAATAAYCHIPSPTPANPNLSSPNAGPWWEGQPVSGAIGDYDLIAELARGGMGVVYQARHRALDRVVALKVMLSDAAARPELASRFEREARAAARLSHPNIVPIHEVGQCEGRPYYTMAFAPGGSLADHKKQYRDPRAAAGLLEKVARAVQAAHDSGVLHRDLKPANILLDSRGEPLVSDFGLAKFLHDDAALTRTGDVLGTPAYMAPEQTPGGNGAVTERSDVWSLGVLLYELLTGKRPFPGPTCNEAVRQVCRSEPPRPRSLRPELDADLESIILRCLQKDPARRYPSAGALADDLRRWLRGERIIPARRRLGVVVALGLVAACLGAGLFFFKEQHPLTEQPALTLLDDGGALHPHLWLVGEKDVAPLPPAESGAFSFRTSELVLLQFLPEPPWPQYRLEAEVRLENSPDGAAGITFAQGRYSAGDERCHCFALLGVMGQGNSSQLDLRLRRVPESGPWPQFDKPCLTPQPLASPRDDGGDRWHRLAVEVAADEVRAFRDGQSVGQRSCAAMREEGTFMFQNAPGNDWQFLPAGGVGLYLREGTASFRKVVVRRLP